jgi:hypothetical protein
MSKGSNRRKEDRAAVEANWDAIQWGVMDGVQGVHEVPAEAAGDEDAARGAWANTHTCTAQPGG